MSLTFKEEKKKQRYLIGVVALVLIITGVVVWFGVIKPEPERKIESIRPANLVLEINIDFGALEDPIFGKMEPFYQVPMFEGEVGRANPFLLY